MSDEVEYRCFIGGLSWSTSNRDLKDAFSKFGRLLDAKLGVFEMTPCGLKAVTNPSEIFLSEERSDSEFLAGLAIAVVMDGSRTFVIEIQFPIPGNVAFIGELGLGGELHMVPKMEKRVSTVAKLGYKKCVVPGLAVKLLRGLDFGEIEVLGCKDLKDVINNVFITI